MVNKMKKLNVINLIAVLSIVLPSISFQVQAGSNLVPIDSNDKNKLKNEVSLCENQMRTVDFFKKSVFLDKKKLSSSENKKRQAFENTYREYESFLQKRKIELRSIRERTVPAAENSPNVVFRGKTSFDIELNGYKNACMKNTKELEAFLYWIWGKTPKNGFKEAYGIDNPDRTFALYLK